MFVLTDGGDNGRSPPPEKFSKVEDKNVIFMMGEQDPVVQESRVGKSDLHKSLEKRISNLDLSVMR